MKAIVALVCLLAAASASRAAYVVPIGVPDPALTWGALHPVDTPNPTRTTIAPGWFLGTPRASTVAQGDPADCYYIDNSAVGATDSSNTFGYPGHARLTIPAKAYTAGNYIEIHGDGATGTYKYTTSWQFWGVGTDTSPIFVVGINSPILSAKLDIGAANVANVSYVVFDGLHFLDAGRFEIRPRFDNNAMDHIVLRNSTLNGSGLGPAGNGVAVGSATFVTSRTVNDVFVYNCDIGYYGDKTAPNEECAVSPGINLTRFWITDCDVHDVAEDGFSGGHGIKRLCTGYYIARNHIHDNVTNGIDIKQCEQVVISENEIEDAHISTPLQSGSGEAIVLHYAVNSSPGSEFDAWKNWPADVTVINNVIHDSDFGVVCSSINKCRIVGNVFYNINHSTPFPDFNVTSAQSTGMGVSCRGVRGNLHIVNNTFYNCDGNIALPDTFGTYSGAATYYRGDKIFYPTTNKAYECILDNSGSADPAVGISGIAPSNATYWREFRYQVWGNIGTARAEPTGVDLFISAAASAADFAADIDYNLFYHSGGAHYCYGSSTQHDLTWFLANSPHQDHGLSSDPLLVAPGSLNFALNAGSPAIDTSTEGTGTTAYADFASLFGMNIKQDSYGVTRPTGGGWDMGAFEFSGAVGDPRTYPLRMPRRR